MSSTLKRDPSAARPGESGSGSGLDASAEPSPVAESTGESRTAPETAVEALGRFGTDRLGDEQLETDRLLAIAHRHRSPEVRLQAALRAEAGRLLANWIVRIANLPIYRARPDLRLDQLMEGLPAVVHAVLQAAATPDPAVDPEPGARAAEVAASHARRRAEAGFPIGAVLAELRELHAELLAQLWRLQDETLAGAEDATTPRGLIERLAMGVGELQIAAADAWAAAVFPTGGDEEAGGADATSDKTGQPREGQKP